ncbi:copper chaperone CopZ [Algoriphagus ratkowskyi]|uniref:Mercuric transport protein MerT n=1 Tax=Algoriphagus ratkowskyi TaxID=57028 RepID=A0A2W7RJK7_9BACT|nr:mercuric transport protein MerTP [Algoriphagus ratkowskyi]PZX61013.1 copper chaperone CopZ [Algoriphagus ratkowskyi]TXD79151.1 mercuric transport protein MerTP [Algoriphagus ratkowskyi]
MKSENKLAGIGILTAFSASLCCITPVLALLAGTSGLASTFSWLDPLRPYLVGLTVLVLGFVWYQKLKPQKQIDCNCETTERTPLIQTKTFLGIVTVFAGLMLAFPTYAHIFFPKTETQIIVTEQFNIRTAEFTINGMTCSGCEEHVNHEVNMLKGIVNTSVSYDNGNAIVEFDKTQTDIQEIEKAIAKTGYSVTDKKEIK